MLNSKMKLEKFLQQQRFKKVLPYLQGDVLDFGGNKGELQPFVNGTYSLVNYDYSVIEKDKHFDLIVALAVIEHIDEPIVKSIFEKFKTLLKPGGCILITTPLPASKPLLEFLAFLGLLDKENINEHKHYWQKTELYNLAHSTGFSIGKYKKFQFGLNQFAKFIHKN
jgi:2-polyprenyl-3-methyl-5-hydroxy-6-metoxy-1,4-benzoquinol methylase